MTFHVVNLQVTAGIPIDGDFWSEDEGWKGFCKSLSITVSGSSFEDAKKNMATELQAHIERILQFAANCLSQTGFKQTGKGKSVEVRRAFS